MFDELREIDTAAIDELTKTKEEQELLEDRLARMDEEKEQVTEAVYNRVRQDYETRCRDLEENARPLKNEARLEHTKLQALRERLKSTLDTARLDKEELELRHRLGEHDDETFQQRLGECEKQIEAREGELRETDELRQRFVDAFRSEEELELPPDESAAESAEPDEAAGEVGEVDEAGEIEDAGEVGETGETDDGPEAEASEAPEAAADDTVATAADSDESLDKDDTTSTQNVETIPPPPPTQQLHPSESEATVLLKGPRLVIHRDDAMEEIRLGVHALTIGRAVKNDIRFLSTSVSRHHAQVTLGDNGYLVNDLRSGNGTLVNGEPVEGQRPLRDGDMIQVGSEVLIFRDR